MSSHLKRIAKKLKTAPDFAKPTLNNDGIFTEFELLDDGKMAVNRVSDVGPVLKRNRTLFNDVSTKSQMFKGDMRQVASVPLVVIEKWMKEGLIKNPYNPDAEDKKAFKRLLNDPDNRFLRTCPGNI